MWLPSSRLLPSPKWLLEPQLSYSYFRLQKKCTGYFSDLSQLPFASISLGREATPVHPKGNQVLGVPWKDWCWSWNSNTLATWCKELTYLKRPWCWERLRAGGEGDNKRWNGWMALPTQWTWVWVDPGVADGQGGLACWGSWGCKESDTTEQLNWTECLLRNCNVSGTL